jgi:hypothetical protein
MGYKACAKSAMGVRARAAIANRARFLFNVYPELKLCRRTGAINDPPENSKSALPGSGKFATESAPVMETAKSPVRDGPKAVVRSQKLPLVPDSWRVKPGCRPE